MVKYFAISEPLYSFVLMKELKQFLLDHATDLNFSTIERKTGLPRGTISRVVNDEQYRYFTPEQEAIIYKHLLTLGKKISAIVVKNLADSN